MRRATFMDEEHMRYAHPSEEHQFNAMRKIEAYRAANG